MNAGDFSELAEDYAKYRPDYSKVVLHALTRYVQTPGNSADFLVADVGAGTGIWTKMLADHCLNCVAVEPNNAMRAQGAQYTQSTAIQWFAGAAEQTGLPSNSVNWVTMASSFHWVQLPEALTEFNRILKPEGYLTVLWNPRAIEENRLHEQIEKCIYDLIPNLSRVSSGSAKHSRRYDQELVSTGAFRDVLFFEARHEIIMSKTRYIGIWRSVNDIQRQAGPELFKEILVRISEIIGSQEQIVVPYKTRAWTAQRV